jgi:hypothetical protein
MNTVMGYVLFGIPAALCGPALVSTVHRYGLGALGAAVLATLWACAPLLLWIRYTRHRPTSRHGRLTWVLLGTAALITLLISPIWFWSGPVLVLLLLEISRVVLEAIRARRSTARANGSSRRGAPARRTSLIRAARRARVRLTGLARGCRP